MEGGESPGVTIASSATDPSRVRVLLDRHATATALLGAGAVLGTLIGIMAFGWPPATLLPGLSLASGAAAAGFGLRAAANRRLAVLEVASEAAVSEGTRKAQFLASMSHEIRTPMNGILGMAELLLRTPLDSEQQQMASTIQASADALLAVLNDILDFSKIEAGRIELEAADFDLWQLLDDCAALLHGNADQKGVELLTFVDPRIGRCHRGDAARIRQVLLNFLSNAVKFTLEGEVVVAIDLVLEDETTQTVRCAVRDTGVGIAEEAMARLFQPFVQADASTTRRFGGTGLGLVICHRLVGMMGGRVEVTSRPGAGSTFAFELALPKGDSTNARTRCEDVDLSAHAVLIVDDNETSRRLLMTQLLPTGIGIDLASNAISGLDVLRQAARAGRPFTMVILDMAMPGIDGMQFAKAIRNDPSVPPLAISLASSLGARPGLAEMAEVDVFRWLSKPLAASRVLQVVTDMASLRRGAVAPTSSPAPVSPPAFVESTVAPPQAERAVLVAEDNEINRRVLAGMLKRIGYLPTFAVDGREAVQWVQQKSFALVLMDCQMPEMDGFDATRAIRALGGEFERLPILALTANVLPADRDACLQAGMNDFLSKPVKLDVLRTALQRWTGSGCVAQQPGDPQLLGAS